MKASNQFSGNKTRTDLLDELTRLAGCDFLSNLPRPERRGEVHRALRTIDPRDYSKKAWIDAAIYICGTSEPFETVEQARDYLLEKTKQKSDRGG